ncbi:MAG: hemin-degrading factor [Chloracidobacterium sp.]|nr:hemin-degrading factor [Chloracidobacterium sp.]MDW8218111.1 ChuX/HutX family heme-like substrate-binding protein [Acidobacteriota bacterium]
MTAPNPATEPTTDAGYTAEDIAQRWALLRQSEPKLRIRDAATKLGVSEAQLVALGCGTTVTRLSADWGDFIQRLEALGPVMALTRNDAVVIEKDGQYRNVEIFSGHTRMGQVLDSGIDLRLFLDRWAMGFAVREESPRGLRRSFQFFDAAGTAVHKTFLREASNVAAFDELTNRFAAPDQRREQGVTPPPPPTEIPDAEVDVEGFRRAWRELKDTHDFIRLTHRFKLSRTQALRLADPEMAWRVRPDSFARILEEAAAAKENLMVFVGNPGCIQIHSGPIHNVKLIGEWLNVLDDGFNLHVHEPQIASAWVVRKPTVRGVVTGVEFFDAAGEQVAILHAKRKEGEPPSAFWAELCERLTRV